MHDGNESNSNTNGTEHLDADYSSGMILQLAEIKMIEILKQGDPND